MARRLSECLTTEDFRKAARRRAHKMVFDYIDGGADDEKALRGQSDAFDEYAILHKVLTGNSQPSMKTSLMGEKIDVPFILSPAAGNRLFHTDGEIGPALAAQKVGTAYCLSTLSSRSIEEISSLISSPKWFQLYVWKDRGLVRDMLDRAKAAGFTALILTVDFPITGNRERDTRNGFTIPPKMTLLQAYRAALAPFWSWDYVTKPAVKYANLAADTPAISLQSFVASQLSAEFNWKDAEWLLGEWGGPAMIKGILHPSDAIKAVKTGFQAISLSHHGGRQLDASAAPVHCVKLCRDAINGDAQIVLDGGIRRGTDIIKALALGADAVSFARPYLYGLAAFGSKGAIRAVELIMNALRRDLILAGISDVQDIPAQCLLPRVQSSTCHLHT